MGGEGGGLNPFRSREHPLNILFLGGGEGEGNTVKKSFSRTSNAQTAGDNLVKIKNASCEKL